MVYTGVFPADGARYDDLKEALLKLQLNDASLSFDPEVSTALGFGFRCGFLGLLHMEIIEERLEREFDLDLITTAPSVSYIVTKTNGEKLTIDNPTALPNPSEIAYIEEPIVKARLFTPPEYVGAIMELCQGKRGVFVDMSYIDPTRVQLIYRMPLNEIIYDFFDSLKSRTRGYASLDYEMDGFEKSDLVRLDMMINGDMCDALSIIVHKDNAYARGRGIAEKLKDVIPRQLFEIPIQATVGGKIIARETVKAVRKDVLAKCYGGDITRKKNCLKSKKKAKNVCAKWAVSKCPAKRLSPFSKSIPTNKRQLPRKIVFGVDFMQLYLHIPFCKSKCAYCDFNSYACHDQAVILRYLTALNQEITLAGKRFADAKIDTVYIGGGTPSALDERKIESVLTSLENAFDLSAVKEFSIECNPESITDENLPFTSNTE